MRIGGELREKKAYLGGSVNGRNEVFSEGEKGSLRKSRGWEKEKNSSAARLC